MYIELNVQITKGNAQQVIEIIQKLDKLNAISHYAAKNFTDIINDYIFLILEEAE